MAVRVAHSGYRAALALLALAMSCAPVSLDRGEPTDGRTDFMRAGGRTGGAGARTGGSTGSGGDSTPAPTGGGGGGGSGQASGEGGAGGAGEPVVDATPEDLRDAKILPALRDASAASCTNVPDWKPGFLYEPGATVAHTTPRRKFKCRPWPNSGWCSSAQYEPNGPKGYWPDAWIDEGVCP
jgi:hypothetical protein